MKRVADICCVCVYTFPKFHNYIYIYTNIIAKHYVYNYINTLAQRDTRLMSILTPVIIHNI